ncbi:DUF2147 domain-containing protein [Porphyromonas sp. COT-290 OH860]|uniref:DUF2147 domain-containing protein n=1 Tax=Porphyromonas sp. COT-290 OH860 TaxID=1515615 RepID=UPI00052C1626|nr:DUF2147 domain-containing protein [Porphyromonas sp. COT-290 OH860]KGN86248.1 hypothetical protein HQ41_01670 [Porphyromonas sp. COT-290 OH860]
MIALALVTLLTVQLAWGQQEADRLIGTYYTAGANGNLKVRGFIGVSLIGRTTEWTRLSE